MSEIIWCKNCILPNTRPNLNINEETILCSVCDSTINNGKKVDWEKRKEEFQKILKEIKKKKFEL